MSYEGDRDFPESISPMSYEGDKDFPEFASSITPQNLSSSGCHSTFFGNDEDEASMESVLCFPGSRLIPTGLTEIDSTEDIVMFVNAGGGSLTEGKGDFLKKLKPDVCFQGGQVSRTEENLIEGGDYASIYQSLRYGNFCYQFDNLRPGDYIIDLHFAEIIYSNGPKGMRVFNVFLQEEKVVSKLDIYSIVGGNKPLQLLGIRVSVGDNGVIVLRFEGVHGSSMISGICIKRASKLSATEVKVDPLICNQCAAKVEVPLNRQMQVKCTVKYEKKIQELTMQCQLKSNECYEAWMSLTAANEQLDKVRMELGDRIYHAHCLEKVMENQTTTLKDISSRYEKDKELWVTALSNLEGKVMMMKKEQYQLSREAHECADSIPELNKMVYAVGGLVCQYEGLKLKFGEEQTKRKKLHNQILEAKGNIRVFCRCRPLNKEEVSAGFSTVIDFDAAKDGYLGVLPSTSSKKSFKFDRVFTPKDDQVAVFEDASPVVISVLDGYNVCIFAYGQTGTGKTFTMEGTAQNRGVNYRTIEELFKVAKERSDTVTYNISVSVLEVYNEQIRDLLAAPPTSKKLEIRQASEGVHHVPGLVEAKVGNVKEVWDVLQAGSNARAVGSNNVNEHSSRSHCMLCITVIAKNMINGECTKSKLWLVDLAGSERLAKTDVQGDRLKEAQNINRSLSALGDVVSALANKSSHVPFRNSKLTHLLQDSLGSNVTVNSFQGGDSKMLMFVQISPSENDFGETLSSLNFATRVRGVELGPAKKQIDMGELQKMKMMLDKAKQESRIKEESFRKLEENFQNLENSRRSKDQLCKSQLDKVKELQAQLDLKIESYNQMEKQLLYFNEQLKESEETCIILQNKVKELEDLLKKQAQQQSESLSLQQKVKELENKLKEQAQQQSESSSLQQKVMDLEKKLKERVQQQPESLILQLKVKEVENKLKERDQDSEHRFLHQKVKELENKLKERDQNSDHGILHQKVQELEEKQRHRVRQSETLPLSNFGESSRFAQNEGKVRLSEESMSEHNLQILQSSDSINCPSRESDLLRGIDSLREVRRKRESRSGENENNCCTTILNEKKIVQIESKKLRQVPGELDSGRQVCNAKPLERLTRTIKPVTSQRQFSHGRTNRDQALGTKDREKTRIWSR